MNSIPIIYENDDICIINKSSGLAVQGGKGVLCAVDGILARQKGYKVYLVHRLDKDTAGLLITAKNSAAAALWTRLVSSEHITKQYCALCTGIFPAQTGLISDPVVHKGSAKSALTSFCVIKQQNFVCAGRQLCFSLVRLTLATGRMHQIRIHLAGQGTPIAADDKYGDFKLNRILRKNCGIKKLHLAAVCLSFSQQCRALGQKGCAAKRILPGKFEVSLPDYMNKTLGFLGFGT